MGGCCSTHGATTPEAFTEPESSRKAVGGGAEREGGGGGAGAGGRSGGGISPSSSESKSVSPSPEHLRWSSSTHRGGASSPTGPGQGRSLSRIHSVAVTPVNDDALACAVIEASSSGDPKACWIALGALMKRSLAEAGGKQALHRRWATQKPGVMLTRCRALVRAVDTLLGPVADHVDAHVGSVHSPETWAEIQLSGLLKHVKAAVEGAVTGSGSNRDGRGDGDGSSIMVATTTTPASRLDFAETVGHLVDILGALWEVRRVGMPFLTSSVDARGSFTSSAADRILSMASVILCRRVALESREDFGKLRADLNKVLAAVGFAEADRLAPLVRCAGKALLLYVQGVAERGESKADVRVRRGHAFWDSLDGVISQSAATAAAGGGGGRGRGGDLGMTAAVIAGDVAGGNGQSSSSPGSPVGSPLGSPRRGGGGGGGEGVESGTSWKVFPQFVAEGWNKGSVEEGEGHGPRKEFFALAGKDMCGRGKAKAGEGEESRAGPSVITVTETITITKTKNDQRNADQSKDEDEKARATKNCPPLFVYNREAGAEWFNHSLTKSKRLQSAYRFAGWLMGQAMNNRCELDVRFPRVLFTKLLEGAKFSPTMEMLQAFDPEAARGIRNVETQLSDQDFAAMVQLEGLPKGTSRRGYVQNPRNHACSTHLSLKSSGASARANRRPCFVGHVAWQFSALRAGFKLAVRHDALRTFGVTDEDLHEIVCGRQAARGAGAGTEDFDIRATFRVVMDDELTAEAGEPLREALWSVLDGWTRERKARFVHFVTGSDRLPVPGMELLRVEMPFIAIGPKDLERTLGMLPQAHTCENILELPNYWQCLCSLRGVDELGEGEDPAEFAALKKELLGVLEERFQLAIENCDSYGLDDCVGGGPVVGGNDVGGSHPQQHPAKLSASNGGATSLGFGFGFGGGGGGGTGGGGGGLGSVSGARPASFHAKSAEVGQKAKATSLVPLPRSSFTAGGDTGSEAAAAAPRPPPATHQLPPLRAGPFGEGAPPPPFFAAAAAAGGGFDSHDMNQRESSPAGHGHTINPPLLFGQVNRGNAVDDDGGADGPDGADDGYDDRGGVKHGERVSSVDDDIAWLENL